MSERAALARRAIPLVDLTDLSDACAPGAIPPLVEKAFTPFGPVAALCVWPAYVADARARLRGRAMRVATVVNFPAGGTDVERVVGDVEETLRDGADEIDLVLPYRAFLAGDANAARAMVEAVAAVLPPGVPLKVILETGVLGDPARVADASRLAVAAGATMLKTSTGKTPVSATLEAARAMLEVVREAGRPVGLKVSGGVRDLDQVEAYLGLADAIMGPGWATPATMRFGASALLDTLVDAARP